MEQKAKNTVKSLSATLNSELYTKSKITFHQGYREFFGLHNHSYWEFFIVTKGSYDHELNGKVEVVNRGDAYLLRPDKDYHIIKQKEPDSVCLFLTITIPNMRNACLFFSNDLYDILYEKDTLKCFLGEAQIRKIHDLCFYIQDALSNNSNKFVLPSSLLLQSVITTVIDQNCSFGTGKPEWLIDLLKQMQDPRNKNWHVSDVLANANYSHSHISRFFQNYMGCSIIDYLREIKMQYAMNALVYSNVTVYEVSNALGYKSTTNFSAVFKGAFGLSPAEYRKKYRKTQSNMEGKDLV